MRKILLITSVISLYSVTSFAQVEKNAIYPELSFRKKLFDYNTNGFQTGISIGLSEHSTAGIFYSRTRYNSMPSQLSTSHSVTNTVGLSYTYYSYFRNSKKWGWSANGTVSYTKAEMYYKPNGSASVHHQSKAVDLSITPGVFFQPSKKIMITANIGGFSLYNSRHPLGTSISSFGGDLNLGIRIRLGNKRK